jgi:hypothetical protein
MSFGKGGGGDTASNAAAMAEEQRKTQLRNQINSMFGIGGTNPQAAAQFQQEDDSVGNATRDYYTAAAKKAYDAAERNLRFGAARTGNTGDTAYADAESKLNEDNALGATRISDAVQQAVEGLRGQREQTRLNSINLVNAGSGADAVNAASEGLRGALANAQSATKQNLFGDLFSDLAFNKVAADSGNQNAAIIAQFLGKKTGLPGSSPESQGNVIPFRG